MKKLLKIQGMTCGHCANHVKEALEGICGVNTATIDLENGQAVVDLTHDVVNDKFISAVDEAGYEVISVK